MFAKHLEIGGAGMRGGEDSRIVGRIAASGIFRNSGLRRALQGAAHAAWASAGHGGAAGAAAE